MPDAPVTPIRHIFYLHGFASSARSKKAAFFAERLRGHGLPLHCPDFNEPDFTSLTMTRMLDQVARRVDRLEAGPIALIGSSLGAVVAIHTATRLAARVDRLVLLAPAVMFAKDGHRFLGPERVAGWRTSGTLDVFHFGYGGMRPLAYLFYEDSLEYDAFAAAFRQPSLVFQGMRDDAVDHRVVEKYASERSHVTLSLLDDDHQLIASLPRIWSDVEPFLGLTE